MGDANAAAASPSAPAATRTPLQEAIYKADQAERRQKEAHVAMEKRLQEQQTESNKKLHDLEEGLTAAFSKMDSLSAMSIR